MCGEKTRLTVYWGLGFEEVSAATSAKEMLLYVFGRQRRNIGVHSRYIDGTVLEPGFELDELMAPVLAMGGYIGKTMDTALLEERCVRDGIALILEKLWERKHPEINLFSTFLQPTDDEIVYPYITYNNVLVWRGLRIIGGLYPNVFEFKISPENIYEAIQKHCVFKAGDAKYYAWSVDLEGRHDVYDEPPGSLQLLAHYGFCKPEEEVYQNTVSMIRSLDYAYSFAGRPIAEIGCPHAPYPWILSIANSMLSGFAEQALEHLEKCVMDNGIACESVDADTGECRTGEAFATCAGFLCYAIRHAFGEENADAQRH